MYSQYTFFSMISYVYPIPTNTSPDSYFSPFQIHNFWICFVTLLIEPGTLVWPLNQNYPLKRIGVTSEYATETHIFPCPWSDQEQMV